MQKERDQELSESEYKTGSEFIPEFQSDHEAPEDVLIESKLIVKMNNVRVYKKILKFGSGMDMASKCDKIVYKMREIEEESLNAHLLADEAERRGQLGVDITDQELIFCLENIKAGETCTFKIERVTYTDKKKRVLDSERFIMVHMVSWETIIDINGDRMCMKKVVRKGVGQKRYNILDEISFEGRVFQQPENTIRSFDIRDEILTRSASSFPTTMLDVLMTGKVQEKMEVTINPDYWEQFEKNGEFKEKLEPGKELYYELEIHKIHEMFDLYHDGSVLKKTIKGSFSTSTPDENSRMYFDYMIYDKSENLIFSSCKSFLNLTPLDDDIPSMEEREVQKIILDEFDVSDCFKKALSIGKKLEEFDLIVNRIEGRFEFGEDYKKVRKIVGKERELSDLLPLRIRAKVYFFSHGENCYSMGYEQKKRYCEIKKFKIAGLLKEKHYDRAYSMLKRVREMTEKFDQHQKQKEEIEIEADQLKEFRRSALLNSTLCQWKLGLWKELIDTCEIVLQLEQNNKVFYRLCVGIFERKDYHLLIERYLKYKEQNPMVDTEYPEILEVYNRCIQNEKVLKSKEKNMYGGILNALQ